MITGFIDQLALRLSRAADFSRQVNNNQKTYITGSF